MSMQAKSTIDVGQALPVLETGSISRHMIARYAAASGDLNAIHVDIDYAREKAGLPDVIVHGMFVMGYLSRVAADWAGPRAIRSLETRFEAMVQVKESLRCEGKVTAVASADGGRLVTIALVALKSDGSKAASGVATAFIAS